MAAGVLALGGDPGISVTVRESRRARRLSLRVSGVDGKVTLTKPPSVSRAEALAFVEEKRDWIAGALLRVPGDVRVGAGAVLPVRGRMLRIDERRGVKRPRIDGGMLFLPPSGAGAAAEAFLKLEARGALAAACDGYARRIGRPYAAITLRDTRSRWGSCTEGGRLMFSWRLAMAPPEVLDYVAAHEVAHLVHMDHSRAFWRQVEALVPDWRRHRDWLKAKGPELHRYRFRD